MKKKFSIKITKPIVGKRFGVFQHIMKGAGSEKIDMRKYSADDSISQINRKLSAKYQELYTNIFQQEKSLSVDIFFDINYNRRGGKIPNKEQVYKYAEDIIAYCKKQQIYTRFFYPKQRLFGKVTLLEKTTKKNIYETKHLLDEILANVQKTKKIYESLLHDFLYKTVEEKGRRAIVIFSDFLTIDDEAKKLLHYLKKQHILFLFQLPIDPEQGQNYSKFFMKKTLSAGRDTSKGSGEIELLQVD